MKTAKFTWTAVWLLTMLLTQGAARAVTIDTFSFVQGGYPAGATLSGTFMGTLEPDGSIRQADLSAFSATFTVDLGQPFGIGTDHYYLQDLQLFSFQPGPDGPNSSLDFFARTLVAAQGSICAGAAAAFGLCGQSPNAAGGTNLQYAPNPFLFLYTTALPVVTLVPPSLTGNPSTTAPPAPDAPEPGTFALFGLALLTAGLWRRRRAVL